MTQASRNSYSRKGLLAVALLVLSLVTTSAVWIDRALLQQPEGHGLEAHCGPSRRSGNRAAPARPDAAAAREGIGPIATAASRRSSARPPTKRPSRSACGAPVRPATGAPSDLAGGRTGRAVSRAGPPPGLQPTARLVARPALPDRHGCRSRPEPLDSTRRNLDGYQRQLQGLLDTLTKTHGACDRRSPNPVTRPAVALRRARRICKAPSLVPPTPAAPSSAASSKAPPHRASLPGCSATAASPCPKGTAFTCALKTRVVSATSGFVELPGPAQRLRRRRPGAPDRTRLAHRRRVPDHVGASRHGAHPGPLDPHSHAARRDGRHRFAGHRTARRIRHRRLRRQPLGRADRRGDAAVADRRRGEAADPEPVATTAPATPSSCRRRPRAAASSPRRCSTARSTSRR